MLNKNEKEDLNLNNLTEMLCPKCSDAIEYEPVFEKYGCKNFDCDFKIAEAKFDRTVNRILNPKSREVKNDYENNLEELNNL